MLGDFNPLYHKYLLHFMSWRNNQQYNTDKRFSNEKLSNITLLELKRWMQLKAYGIPDPSPDKHLMQI